MKFLLYSINHSPEQVGIGKYNGELASALAERSVETHVVTALPYYPLWKRQNGFKNRWSLEKQKDNLTVYRCPLYVPKNVSTIKRIIHLFSFACSSALRLLTLLKLKPDILFLVQPTLFCAPAALLYCKLTGAKSIMHIQDFEIDAMFGLGLADNLMKDEGKLKHIIQSIEAWLLKRFDIVSSISYSMLDNARNKGVHEDKLLYFPNWVDTNFITPETSGDTVREDWGFTPECKIVLYSGNIGKKQGLELVLSAAEKLADRKEVKFVIVGSGAGEKTLLQMASDRKLTNVEFKPLQPWSLMPQILAMADVHLVVQKRGVAAALLPSKLTNILSAGGHALVTAEANTELGILADNYPGIYECVEPENEEAFISGLVTCLQKNTHLVNNVARDYTTDNINCKKVINRFTESIQRLTENLKVNLS